jgi:hypothetical protein
MERDERHEGGPARATIVPEGTPTTPGMSLDLCPYLVSRDGNWRSSSAVRDHRCVAVAPPVPLVLAKQRRLCLVSDHVGCATYGAAVAARPQIARHAGSDLRAIARTTPVVLDQGRFDLRLPILRPGRITGQALLVGLLGLAFVAIMIARPAGDGRAPDPTGGIGASGPPVASPPATARPDPASSPPASDTPATPASPFATAPTASRQPTSAPASARPTGPGQTYRVRSGDTLSAIAARYGTTTKVLADLNQIADPSKLKIGQVLRLP